MIDLQRYGRCWLCRVGRSRMRQPYEWLPLMVWIDGELRGIGVACSPGCYEGASVLIRFTEEMMAKEKAS